MSKNSDSFSKLLQGYGLSAEQISIYTTLLSTGSMSALMVSKATKLPRTSIYRYLDELVQLGLVKELQGTYGILFEVSGVEGFERLVKDKEEEAITLKAGISEIKSKLNAVRPQPGNSPKVTIYTGQAGIEQALWNLLSEKEVFVFETGEMAKYVSKRFAERIRREFVVRDIQMKVLTNERQIADFSCEQEFLRSHWEIRSVRFEKFSIESEMFIFGDTLSHFSKSNGKVYVIEVYEPAMAAYQLSLFSLLWKEADAMVRLSPEGRAKVVE